MSAPWLILDVHYLCHRLFHAVGELSHRGIRTGVIFGFLRQIIGLQDQFRTDRLVFCFDYGETLRKRLFAGYKAQRHAHKTHAELTAYDILQEQIEALRTDYLHAIGYRNVISQRGFEGDDLIAIITQLLPDSEQAVIISNDSDLFQLLKPNVSIYQPHGGKTVTLQSFKQQYGLSPRHWARVKALTGCTTDEVPGIKGVQTKTACKYLRGELKPTTQAYSRIKEGFQSRIVQRNYSLVRLPLRGVSAVTLRSDCVTHDGWRSVCTRLGLRSLQGYSPFSSRESRRNRPAF